MVVNGNIKKIMYMGEEISKVMYANTIIWEKQTVKPPPGPKPCTTCQTACEKTTQGGCKDACEKSTQSTGCQTRCEKTHQSSCNTACEKAGQSCGQGCTNCLRICQDNNQISDS